MACHGECNQGRDICRMPERCAEDLGPAFGVICGLAWTLVLCVFGLFIWTLAENFLR